MGEEGAPLPRRTQSPHRVRGPGEDNPIIILIATATRPVDLSSLRRRRCLRHPFPFGSAVSSWAATKRWLSPFSLPAGWRKPTSLVQPAAAFQRRRPVADALFVHLSCSVSGRHYANRGGKGDSAATKQLGLPGPRAARLAIIKWQQRRDLPATISRRDERAVLGRCTPPSTAAAAGRACVCTARRPLIPSGR